MYTYLLLHIYIYIYIYICICMYIRVYIYNIKECFLPDAGSNLDQRLGRELQDLRKADHEWPACCALL